MKFILRAEEEIHSGIGVAPLVHTTEFQADMLPDIVSNIELFLKGAGYSLTNLDYDLPSS